MHKDSQLHLPQQNLYMNAQGLSATSTTAEPLYECIRTLSYIYHSRTFIWMHKDSKPFKLENWLPQRYTMSPKLFIACLESVFQKLNWNVKSIKIDGEYLNRLRFADGTVGYSSPTMWKSYKKYFVSLMKLAKLTSHELIEDPGHDKQQRNTLWA